jgi:stage III sporulation protein AH
MNAKRQTIWLVSMLSLMVVLSAYYLFTEDSGKVDLTTASGNVSSTSNSPVSIDLKDPATAKVDAKDAGKVEVKPDPNAATAGTNAKTDTTATDAKTSDPKAADKATSGQADSDKTTAQAGSKSDAKTDAQIISQMTSASLSGSDFFADAQLKRDEDIAQKTQDYMTITSDQKKSIQEQEKAYNDLDALQTMVSKINNLESLLKKDYPEALVQQDGQKYKVTVQAQKLTPSQAVTIVDTTMKELGIGQDKVVIQYLP